MIGAILGDIIGSPHEFKGASSHDFPLVIGTNRGENRATDDSMLTIALADTILTGKPYVENLKAYYRRYPEKGYGVSFASWADSVFEVPYNSMGNGALMRVSPAGWLRNSMSEAIADAKKYTEVTHNHPSSVLAACTYVEMILNLRSGYWKKHEALTEVKKKYKFADLEACILAPKFNRTAESIFPIVLSAFEHGSSYEECVRTAICAENDTDTVGCIVGGLAEVIYPIPQELIDRLPEFLDADLLSVVKQFHDKYINKYKLNF